MEKNITLNKSCISDMWLTAFMIGLAGSLHCAGMCSPLAMTLTSSHALGGRVLYNFGRITTYGVLGGVIASLGFLFPLERFQNLLSVLLGLSLLAMASAGITGIRIPLITPAMIRFTGWLKKLFAGFLKNKSAGTMLLLGALNGLLPCGLTFLALTFCITLAGPLQGFLYMLCFGAGTLPVMLGLASLAGFFTNKLHWNTRKITTGVMLLSGVLLIARVFITHQHESHITHSAPVEVDIVICR